MTIDKMRMRRVVLSPISPTLGQKSVWTMQPSWFWFRVVGLDSFEWFIRRPVSTLGSCSLLHDKNMCPVFKANFWSKKGKTGLNYWKKCFHSPRPGSCLDPEVVVVLLLLVVLLRSCSEDVCCSFHYCWTIIKLRWEYPWVGQRRGGL